MKLAIFNLKGGTGKTTVTQNLAAGLTYLNKKILAIDSDPQSSLTSAMGHKDLENTLPALLKKKLDKKAYDVKDYIVKNKEGIYLMGSDQRLSQVEQEMQSIMARELIYKKALKGLDDIDMDYILVDCPPFKSLLIYNILAFVDAALIVISPDYLTLNVFSALHDTIEEVKEDLNPELKILGLIFNRVDKRTYHAKDIIEYTTKNLGKDVYIFKSIIRDNTRIKEAQISGLSILGYDDKAIGAADFMEASRELLSVL